MSGQEPGPSVESLTLLLGEVESGRPGAMDELMERVYDDLRKIAASRLRGGAGGPGRTLGATALVHETYLRLILQRKRYDNSGQFFAVATRVMMRVLVDHQRARAARKRAGDQIRVTLTGIGDRVAADPDVAVHELIDLFERLDEVDARSGEVVKLRVLWGLTEAETAEAIGVSEATVRREWRFGRRWIQARLAGG